MNNYRAYQNIKNDIKSMLKDYDKIKQYNAEDMDFYETIGMEKKIEDIREKLERKKELTSVKNEYTKKNQEKLKSNIMSDNNVDDDFRSYNIFIPKVDISHSKRGHTTFANMSTFYDEYDVEIYPVMKMSSNKLETSKEYNKINTIQAYKPDPLFFSNRYIEYEYNDVCDREVKRKNNNDVVYDVVKKTILRNNMISTPNNGFIYLI
jgi:hypothetical protein